MHFRNIKISLYLIVFIVISSIFKIEAYQQNKKKFCKELVVVVDSIYDALSQNEKDEQKSFKKILRKIDSLAKISICKNQFKAKVFLLKSEIYKQSNNLDSLSKYAILSFEAYTVKNKDEYLKSITYLVHLYTRLNEDYKIDSYIKLYSETLSNKDNQNDTSTEYNWLAFQYENRFAKTKKLHFLDSALYYSNKAMTDAKNNNNYMQMALSYRVKEANAYHKKRFIDAIKYIDSAIFYAKNSKENINLGPFYLSKSWDYVDLNKNKEAAIYIDSAITIHDKNYKNTATSMMMHFEASNIYEIIGNPKKSLYHFKIYNNLNDSIRNIKKLEYLNEIETKYKTRLKDATIQNLQQKEEINQLQIANKNATIYKLTFALIFTLVIIIIIVYIIKIRELKKLKIVNVELQKALEKQQILEQKLIETRDHIAQDFHDDLGNVLARISLQTKLLLNSYTIENENITSNIKQINSDVNTLYQETRDFIFSLKTNSDDIFEFVNYLIDFGEDLFKNSTINFTVLKEIEQAIKLPDYWSRQLILIFKEAFTNTLKHANAANAKLTIIQQSTTLKVIFYDDGKGFKLSEFDSKNGLANIKRRAIKIGVELQITSNSKGTTISINGKI